MNVNTGSQSPASTQQCYACKKAFSTKQLSVYLSPRGQRIYLCDSCIDAEKAEVCYLCQDAKVSVVVAVDEKQLPGAITLVTKDAYTMICPLCASKQSGIICKESLAAEKSDGSKKPRAMNKFQSFLCGDCHMRRVTFCDRCEDAISLGDGQSYNGAQEVLQKEGQSLWYCTPCSQGVELDAWCICGTQLIDHGKCIVSYTPEKVNGFYLCNDCKQLQRVLCDGCNKLVGIKNGPTITQLGSSKTYPYSQLTVCSACRKGAITCLCGAPAATSLKQPFPGAYINVDDDEGNSYRCKFCNRALIDDSDREGMALYSVIYRWLTSPLGLGLSLPPFEKAPLLLLAGPDYVKKYSGSHGVADVRGLYDSENQTLVVENALTQVRFRAVVIHELVHYWQYMQGIFSKQSDYSAEGFAQWVAYWYLGTVVVDFTDEKDKREAIYRQRAMLENLVSDYREGLKYFLKIGGLDKRKEVLDAAMQKDKKG